jgi:hypothetical protein
VKSVVSVRNLIILSNPMEKIVELVVTHTRCGCLVMGHRAVKVVGRVDQYWRSDVLLCPDFDLVISANTLNNRTIMASTITIKFPRAYNFVMVSDGRPGDTPRSWWFSESTRNRRN